MTRRNSEVVLGKLNKMNIGKAIQLKYYASKNIKQD